jgi:hypothetical protein
MITLKWGSMKKYIKVGLTVFKDFPYIPLYIFCQGGKTEIDKI